MAHIGKFYPLWFRRDTCLGCTNHRVAIGLVQGIRANFFTSAGPNPGEWNLFSYGFLQTEPDDLDAVWQTETFTDQGHAWKLRSLFKRWDFDLQRTKMRIEVYRDDTLVLYHDGTNSSAGNCRHHGNTGIFTPTWVNPAIWPDGITALAMTSAATIWAEIPPEA